MLFHLDFADRVERSMFFKDQALAGGLPLLAGSAAQTGLVSPLAPRPSPG